MIISAAGTVIRTDWRSIAQCGRPTQGVRLMHLGSGDRVVAIATMYGDDDEDVVADVAYTFDLDEDDEDADSGK
jgi:hypothetical protein